MIASFQNNAPEVLAALNAATLRALEKCGLVAERHAKENITRNRSVDTGNLRNSIDHKVDPDERAVYIGTNTEYAAYVELGTGKYILGGRPTPWRYQDEKGRWHTTQGQPAKPYLKPAVAEHAQQYRDILEGELKNG